MKRWTLACDESGSFDTQEQVALVVGAVLLPGGARSHQAFKDELMSLCARLEVGFPPHSTDLRRDNRSALLEIARTVFTGVEARGGLCIALVSHPGRQRSELALHIRMLGSLVDISTRVAAGVGVEVLDLEIASRTFPLSTSEAWSARREGLFVKDDKYGQPALGVAASEIREAIESLHRTSPGPLGRWPAKGGISVRSASNSESHVGVWIADLLCNQVYATLGAKPKVSFGEIASALGMDPDRLLLVESGRAHLLRRCDQCLRLDPIDWMGASRILSSLEAAATPPPSADRAKAIDDFPGSLEGTSRAAALLWQQATGRASAVRGRAAARGLKQLAGSVQTDLDLKSGSYDAAARALEHVWHGDGELATRLREACTDRELAARLWRLTQEAANHRGDTATSDRARQRFDEALLPGVSLELLAEAFRVRNLTLVSQQNLLPAGSDGSADLMARLANAARELERFASQARELGAALGLSSAGTGATAAVPPAECEQRLRAELGYSGPCWESADREYGSCLGTVARALAFTGALDEATPMALRARARFADSPDDLRFNASVIVRIELERARLRPERVRSEALRVALQLAGVDGHFTHKAVLREIRADPGLRFTLELWLRSALWAEHCLPVGSREAWEDELAKAPRGGLYPALEGLRSHPTELVARHAAEVLARRGGAASAVESWFRLSLAVSDGAPEGTLRRLGAFSQVLARGGTPAEAPYGSILNPSFEYR